MDDARRLEVMSDGLRRTYDAAGGILREKPDRFVRWMARLARKRARLGLEALGRGDLFEAGSLFGWAKDALGIAVEHRKHVQLYPDAKRGRLFREGSRKPRDDALARLIDEAVDALPARPSAIDVLRMVESLGVGDTIDEVVWDDKDGPRIYWRAHNGRERKPTGFKAFQNRLSGARKKSAA